MRTPCCAGSNVASLRPAQTTQRWRGTIRRLMSYVSRAAPASIRSAVKDVEFARRTAFVVPFDASSTAIRLNLLGREPHGKVQAGDYEAHCQFLTSSFLALVDPSSGRRLVADVVNVAKRFPGPRASAFADLLVVWERGHADRRCRFRLNWRRGRPAAARSFGQSPTRWLVCGQGGPGINAGEICSPVRVVDFARTVGTLHGVDLNNVEGDPIAHSQGRPTDGCARANGGSRNSALTEPVLVAGTRAAVVRTPGWILAPA